MTQLLSAHSGMTPTPRRYLAIFLPWMSAEQALRAKRAPPDRPFALVEQRRGAMRIVALDPQATGLGLEPGLPLADAHGRVPELTTLPYDPVADGALLDRLVRLCGTYSPSVEPDRPQGLMLDITGCAHLFGGEEALCHILIARLRALDLTARAIVADTPDAARALARFGVKEVRALPLSALVMEKEARTALHRAGFRSVGELADLPRAPLASRFGEALPALLDRLLARQDPHIIAHRLLDPIKTEMRFAEPISRTEHVLDGIASLMERAAAELAARGEGGRAFAVRLHRSDGHVAHMHVKTSCATRDTALVLRLLRERIESLADPLDPGFGYDAIDLAVPMSEKLDETQQDLESRTRQERGIGPLLDRLAVRHGQDRVMRFAIGDSHIPERAARLKPVNIPNVEASWPAPQPGEPPLRPLLLFYPPQQIEVLAAVPDGPPRRFRWRGKSHSIVRQEGPERIAAEWWRRRGGHGDNPGLTRDYYRVEDEAGRRFWLFRHGLYERETATADWYIHGLFA